MGTPHNPYLPAEYLYRLGKHSRNPHRPPVDPKDPYKHYATHRLTPSVCRSIVASYRPRGWKVRHPRSYAGGRNGLCSYEFQTIFCPRVVDDYTLCVFLHEVYHATHPGRARGSLDEYRAEMYAIGEMRKLGFMVTRHILWSAKDNVWDYVKAELASGQDVDLKVYRWSNPDVAKQRRLLREVRQQLEDEE